MKSFSDKALRQKIKHETDKDLSENYQQVAYEIVRDTAPQMMRQSVALSLYALSQMGFGVKRLNDVFDKIVDVATMPPEMLGRKVRVTDLEKLMKDKYHIDLDRLEFDLPTYEDYKNALP